MTEAAGGVQASMGARYGESHANSAQRLGTLPPSSRRGCASAACCRLRLSSVCQSATPNREVVEARVTNFNDVPGTEPLRFSSSAHAKRRCMTAFATRAAFPLTSVHGKIRGTPRTGTDLRVSVEGRLPDGEESGLRGTVTRCEPTGCCGRAPDPFQRQLQASARQDLQVVLCHGR